MRKLFVLTGAKFYLDYILIDSPSTKNPIYKFLFSWVYRNIYADAYGLKNGVEWRSITAFAAAFAHLYFFVVYLNHPSFSIFPYWPNFSSMYILSLSIPMYWYVVFRWLSINGKRNLFLR